MFDTDTDTDTAGVSAIRAGHRDHTAARMLHETLRGVDTPGQIYALIRTYAIGARMVRVTVHVDNYPQQSRLLAEAWVGNAWREVVRILGEDAFAAEGLASGYLPREHNDEKRQSLERFAGELLQRCMQVIAPAQPDDETTDDLTRAVRAVERAAAGDSNDAEIETLQNALQMALTRWPAVTYAP